MSSQRLATDEVTLVVDGEEIHLRPTLRAAMRLERRFGGFDKLLAQLAGGSVTVARDVIRESGGEHSLAVRFLDSIPADGALVVLDAITAPLVFHVWQLAGMDMEKADAAEPAKGAELITFETFHARLFGLATGWLGWTPDAAWSATPAEILAAHAGRLDMLRAIFGSGEAAPEPKGKEVSLDEFKAFASSGGNRLF